ncbi:MULTISPECIES: MFS transporter [Cupriavidus]|uniref:Transporter, Major facilitator superfamily MFS_1 n=3 Tax=Cupriavidus TaxID=106589 RepID=A0A375CQ23_9BURK|nr:MULTISPECIES: MFS transporter [Cupriavidus]MCO4865614.1 MFS transporter [Cupriavidus sp. WGlv3]MCO4893334.1 MFS transporter [Cupriavidus sp. WGtm5]CAP64260.1 putative transporter, Major facilitator superfamily MFS_1 [Cupriavidus taiwanensis LMG 19424]SOY76587.1 putative transporter, Major facilitator superfamily MFS_1 [Cupriavidus taiwanensis]SOY76640.1 putative transporter, Major facilitator superfamily MFS_1 [Cupriavidus taiwanensis]
MEPSTGVIARLGIAQTLAWGSTYYLPAMLATPMATDLGVSTSTVFAAFGAALIVSAVIGSYAGRMIDRSGGRSVLVATSIVFALGLTGLGFAQGAMGLFVAWLVLGVGMGAGLYEAAFATLVVLYGNRSRGAITGITLIAGLASTVGWPLSTFMEAHIGWRGACLAWAGLHLTLGLLLNASTPQRLVSEDAKQDKVVPAKRDPSSVAERDKQRFASYALAFVFAATWFISTAMAAHLPRLLQAGGATVATAVMVGALIGPAQVGARILEFGLLRKIHPLLSARIAAALHPIGALAFGLVGAPAAALFGVLHGAGNGILTIAKGTLPLVIFGPSGYGHRQGVLMVPARVAQALAPWLFGICLDAFDAKALWLSSALGVGAIVVLMAIQQVEQSVAKVV